MFLYLVRHGNAMSEKEDSSRPLSEHGIQQVKKIALHTSRLNLSIHQIFHSVKLRAKQTADILNDSLTSSHGITEVQGLKPNDDQKFWIERLNKTTVNTILVGHLPYLDKLTSTLLCGITDKNFVDYTPASMVCLKKEEEYLTWSLQWMITPDILM